MSEQRQLIDPGPAAPRADRRRELDPREAVEGEMCLCGACRTRRAFAEAAS